MPIATYKTRDLARAQKRFIVGYNGSKVVKLEHGWAIELRPGVFYGAEHDDPRLSGDHLWGFGYCSSCYNLHPLVCQSLVCFCPCRNENRVKRPAGEVLARLEHLVKRGILKPAEGL